MSDNAYIGIDLGTSGCRAIAINQTGDVIAQSQQAIPSSAYTPPKYEQNPQQQRLVVETVLTQLFLQLNDYQVQNIAVDATSGSVLLVDTQGKALTPILMYNDARSVVESELIRQVAPADSGSHGPSSGLAKLLHLRQQYKPDKNFKLLHQADWINFNLGADLGISDYNNVLKTGYDPLSLSWPEWLQDLVPEQVLPKVVKPGTTIGQLSAERCKQFNLDYAPTIVAGTTDSIAALLATGTNNVGAGVTSLGSTLVLKFISEQPVFKVEQGIYSHRLGESWLVGGASNSGGSVLRHFFSDQKLTELSLQIDLKHKPAEYYPLLSPGERFPEFNPDMQPQLTPRPNNDAEFLHGMFSGIADIETKGYQLIQEYSQNKLTSICTVGGGASNQIWQTIRQQQLAAPFVQPQYTEAAYGAALLAKDRLQHY